MTTLAKPKSLNRTPGPLSRETRETFIKKLIPILGNEVSAMSMIHRIERARQTEIDDGQPPAIEALFQRSFDIIREGEIKNVIPSTERTPDDTATIKTANRYKDAICGSTVIGQKTLSKKLDTDYFDDVLNLYALSGDTSLLHAFGSCRNSTDETARELMKHLVPIAAKLQPTVLIHHALMLLPNPEAAPMYDAALGRHYLEQAVRHSPDTVNITLGKTIIRGNGQNVERLQVGRPFAVQKEAREAATKLFGDIIQELGVMDAHDPNKVSLVGRQQHAAAAVTLYHKNEQFLNELIELSERVKAERNVVEPQRG